MLSPQNFWPPRNFGAIDAELAQFETARFVVIPVPYDSTTTWRGGTREGPMAIIAAPTNMEWFDREAERARGRAFAGSPPSLPTPPRLGRAARARAQWPSSTPP